MIKRLIEGTLVQYTGASTGYVNKDLVNCIGYVVDDRRYVDFRNNVDVSFVMKDGTIEVYGVVRENIVVVEPTGDLPPAPTDETFFDAYKDTLRIKSGKQGVQDVVWLTAKDKFGQVMFEFTDRNSVLDLASDLMRMGLAMDKE